MDDIARLNDRLRRTGLGGQMALSRGIASLPLPDRQAILHRVRTFDDFTEESDPWGVHECGAFDFGGIGRVLWMIEYYDPSLNWHSENPSDPSQTVRVLTVMLASEH